MSVVRGLRATLLGIAALGGASGIGAAWAVDPGEIAPEASGIRIQGPEDLRLSALRGKVVVVDFWASWCAPCIESMPELDAMYREFKAAYSEQFEVLAVGLDHDMDLARRFLKAHPVTYPVVVDTVGIALQNFGVWRLPATFLLDRDGRIQQIYYGYGDEFDEDLRQRTLELLRSRPAQAAP